jgi:hypothetical protein
MLGEKKTSKICNQVKIVANQKVEKFPFFPPKYNIIMTKFVCSMYFILGLIFALFKNKELKRIRRNNANKLVE